MEQTIHTDFDALCLPESQNYFGFSREEFSCQDFQISIERAEKILSRYDSYSRLPTLIDLAVHMAPGEWLELLGRWWPSCDHISVYADELETETPFGWRGTGPIMEMMNEEEQKAYRALPDSFIVYRGCYQVNKWGLSWTLDKEVAEAFPRYWRYRVPGAQPLLVKARAHKSEIIALKLDRDESEVIVRRPRHISTSHLKLEPI